MPKEDTQAARKKMRKGTHSCFECRRRKIRCIFPPDNPDVCSECFARGSRCIDQEHANPDVIVDHRKNLRERVSRLEALVDSLLEDKTEKTERSFPDTVSSKTPNVYTRDAFPPTPLSSEASNNPLQPSHRNSSVTGHNIPLLSVLEDALNDAEEQIKARIDPQRKVSMPKPDAPLEERYTITNRHPEDMMDDTSLAYQAKKERSKQALLGMLPPVDELTRIMNSNSDWWQTWRRKCSGTSSSNQTLSQFAAKAFSEGNIGAIGVVVLAVGICASDESDVDRYIEAVDRWVLSDDEYAATLEGMECLILKAKWYADVGQPRRAFISFRKGLTYAQLMGLHRKRTSSAAHESIWWSLYHGDRFLSLLLGLPYGINDAHCDLTLPEFAEGNGYLPPLIFMNKMSTLAGKVIDRNQVIAEQSFAWALQLDQELEDLWKRLDPNWLEFTELLADVESNAAELRERVMGQMVFHQIRVYLHLPFMLKSASNSRFTYSRNACLNGSREMLRLYQVLRTGATQPLYECKAVDFMAFTSAVLIQLGLFNFGNGDAGSPKQVEEDVRIVEISIDIFRRASSEKGGKVALQSAEVLEKMLTKFRANGGQPGCPGKRDDACMTEFVIPYFGTISIKKGAEVRTRAPEPPMSGRKMVVTTGLGASPAASTTSRTQSQTQFTPSSETASDFFSQGAGSNLTPVTSTSATTDQTFNFSDSGPFASYDGFYNWNNITAENPSATNASPHMTSNAGVNTKINDDSMNNFPLPTNNFSWQSMSMDIDQDWSWFLNDGQTPGVATQPVSDQFAQQGFAGFG